ncbi:MAG: hypothetical protein A2091_06100 [Desulfuromonadales bacterium GWD2_61_12]|nr:MAG: hypothetical protein A2005_07350 [Desulfuromonadales bacterium GWC2_61_20]OGR36416.1 MAG: hypothetical protein A2091_06100 [Desulfuromonadales bacterium GWD2_61_12]HAD03105.1 hypothetical protein [Desulfuromonas sp.]HBT83813.1 hypothetical protein [Desulfuromonas sp.]
MNRIDHRTYYLLVLVVALVLSFAIYANTFANDWTYDDFPVIVNNTDIQSISGFLQDQYPGRPLRELSFLLDYSLFGGEPSGWHVQQIFWHALNGFLLFCVGVRLGVRNWLAALGALLFLVHPVQVEVVAGLSHRKDSLQLAFSLLAFWAYMNVGDDTPTRRRWFALALVAALLAFLAKEQALILLPFFAGYELAMVPRGQRFLARDPRWVMGLLLAGGVAFLLWLAFCGGAELFITQYPGHLFKMNIHNGTLSTYVMVVLKSWAFMAGKFIFPSHLAIEYVFPAPRSWFDPWVVAGAGLLAGYFVSLILAWRLYRPFFVVLLWTGFFWLPLAHLWPVTSYFAADRYLYVISAGVLLGLGALLEKISFRRNVAVLCLALTPFLMVLSWNQNKVWQDNLTLFTRAVQVSPTSSGALTGLGEAYFLREEFEQAMAPLQAAVMNWNAPLSYFYLGHIYEMKGETQKAIRHFCFYVNSKGEVSDTVATKKDISQYLRSRYGTECR